MARRKTAEREEPSEPSESSSGADSTDDSEPPLKIPKRVEHFSEIKNRFLTQSIGGSVIKYYESLQNGCSSKKFRYSIKLSLMNQIKTFRICKLESPFDRRVTSIEWHPNNPRLLAVASKGGDIILWNHDESIESSYTVKGIGAGGSVHAMKFDFANPYKVYSVSMEGKFFVLNFQTKKAEQFLNTLDFMKWYVSLDVNWTTKTMVVGDNKGSLTLLTSEGEPLNTFRAHKSSKITHLEFSRREPWLLCSTSTDRSVRMWDIRQMNKGEPVSICTINNEKPINAAYFSLTDGCRLLTTDQFDRIRVYRSPLWDLETEIFHPHRQFQHLTPIKAYWHPLEDIILIGRYPHKEFPGYTEGEVRSIDFFDADTGRLLHQHSENCFKGIATLNRFNISGDVLATASGMSILLWKSDSRRLRSVDLKTAGEGSEEQSSVLPKFSRRSTYKIGPTEKNKTTAIREKLSKIDIKTQGRKSKKLNDDEDDGDDEIMDESDDVWEVKSAKKNTKNVKKNGKKDVKINEKKNDKKPQKKNEKKSGKKAG